MADSDLPTGLPARLLHRLGWHRKRNDFSGDEIREEELKQIDNRRDVAFIDNEGRSERQLPIEKDLVGIALSGGGLRSAMLNLGLLQSLCKRGFLKHVDFLSGVSGGGYIASYFSKRVVENGFHINEAMEDMAPGSDGKGEPKHVRELIRDGKYLEQPIRALSRYLIGFLWNSVFLVSLLVLFASAAAFVWRCLDDGWLYSWLREITISWPGLLKSSDATRPFLIPVLLFVCWLLAWAAHFVFRGAHQPNRLASHLLLGTLASALIGIAVFLSNGDVVIVPDYWNQGPTVNFRNSPQFVTALVAVLLLLSVFMIPLLKPKELLKSARAPRESAKHWMYRAAMVGSFLGVPFMAVYYFAGENFSNRSLFSNSSLKEDYELKTGHVFNWADLLREIEHGRSNQNGLPSPIWKNLKKDKDVIDQLQRELTTAELKQVHLTKQEKQGWKRIDLIQYRRHLHARESDESLKKSLLDAINAVVNDVAKPASPTALISRKTADRAQIRERLPVQDQELFDRAVQGGYISQRDRRILNRALVTAFFERSIYPRRKVLRGVLVESDQQCRLWWVLGSFFIVLVSGFVVNLNATSMHAYYRNCLEEAFFRNTNGEPAALKLSGIDTVSHGAPYLLLSGTLNLFGRQLRGEGTKRYSFLFSQQYCGSDPIRYHKTADYADDRLDLADVAAISGAAVSPFQTDNPLLRVVMTALNLRLGQWLPAPSCHVGSSAASPWNLVGDFWREPIKRRFCFISDGGQNENLGIWPLIQRRCRLIIAADATQDERHTFADFLHLCRRLSLNQGIEFLDLEEERHVDLRPLALRYDKTCESHFFAARFRYPKTDSNSDEVGDSLLIYLKSSMSGHDEGNELTAHFKAHTSFPHDPTLDQFFDEPQANAYRQLGFHIGEMLCEQLPDDMKEHEYSSDELIQQLSDTT